jgi:hypothetical protein
MAIVGQNMYTRALILFANDEARWHIYIFISKKTGLKRFHSSCFVALLVGACRPVWLQCVLYLR